jgi:hypothetical protein
MKKPTKPLMLIVVFLVVVLTVQINAQEEAKKPEIYVVTTMHWNTDKEDGSNEEWLALEKEYLEKVTMKNEYIMGSSFYAHMLTPDSREFMQVHVYGSWEDIDKATKRNGELVNEAWTDEEARNAYFEKRNSYYADFHSDEIYSVMDQMIPLEEVSEGMIMYMRKNKWRFPRDGSGEEYFKLYEENVEKLYKANEFIKGYYPSSHFYGSDRTDFIEAFFLNSLGDLQKMFDKQGELAKEAWPDENARKERAKKFGKYFNMHGDYVYFFISELTKSMN